MKPPRFWRDSAPGFLARLLSPLGLLYGTVGRHRLTRSGYRAGIPVVCIGNATLGGAGKTPVAMDVAARLTLMGRATHFLSRGHGGRLNGPILVDPAKHTAADVGDEPLLLARRAPTWVARDRAAGARAAEAAGATCLVMDDGMQNPTLAKTLTILVVDSGAGFGNGLVFPAGPLRERPDDARSRADAIVLIGRENAVLEEWAEAPNIPVIRARILAEPPPELSVGNRCVAFCGIGRPEKFFESARSLDLVIVSEIGFSDHHVYSHEDMDRLFQTADSEGAVLLTTEKDAVRLSPEAAARVHVVPMTLDWDDAPALDQLLRGVSR